MHLYIEDTFKKEIKAYGSDPDSGKYEYYSFDGFLSAIKKNDPPVCRNNLLIVDEDVPGGASAYNLQQLLEKQNIFKHLDSKPVLLSAKSHRPAYGSDGDYFSKPSFDDIYDAVYNIMHDQNPNKFPRV